jgi:peptidoglycan/xylan/chitin deacetylase (PgdA/CDA1 family)
MVKKKKPAPIIKRLRSILSASNQKHLVLFACILLGLFTIFQLNSNPDNAKSSGLFKSGPTESDALSSAALKKAKKQAPAQPAVVTPILAWRGPVQPVVLPTSPVPVISNVPTNDPVVFVTMDDGWIQTPENHEWLVSHHLPFSLFLSDAGVRNNYQYFQDLQSAGMTIENHTVNHPSLIKHNLPTQQAEICGAADSYQNVFHHRPTLLRPPYGLFNANTQQAAEACGQRAIIMWRATIQDGVIAYQDGNTTLKPGDIILTHFQPDFIANMQALSVELNKEHLQVAHLEDWLK